LSPAHLNTCIFVSPVICTINNVRSDLEQRRSVVCQVRTAAVIYDTVTWFRQSVAGLLAGRPVVYPWPVHVGFVVNKLTLGEDSVRLLWFSLSLTFYYCSMLTFVCVLLLFLVLKICIEQRVCTGCTRINYKIVPVTNLNKYLHYGTSVTE
jgi:hypothetical protein